MVSYNPFTEDGSYNLKTLITQNKTLIIIVLVIALVLMLIVIWMLYTTDDGSDGPPKPSIASNLPEPMVGDGPFGYGTYLPSKEAITNALYT